MFLGSLLVQIKAKTQKFCLRVTYKQNFFEFTISPDAPNQLNMNWIIHPQLKRLSQSLSKRQKHMRPTIIIFGSCAFCLRQLSMDI